MLMCRYSFSESSVDFWREWVVTIALRAPPLSFAACGCMAAGRNNRTLEGEQMEQKSLVERVDRFHLTPSDPRTPPGTAHTHSNAHT